ncbi:helix-turn-helix domain-containing protein [Flagellimonas sp. S174]|uniref:helix-turn-helix domain-containing protein n=1 Tax=Flagellimonas sp. S174 TaxID=3410790 RepID=UPI003BF61E9D
MTQQHLELNGKAVISHFTFSPPLVAAADLDNTACFIFPIHTKGHLYRADGKTSVAEKQGVLMKCGTYVNKWHNIQEDIVAEVVILRLHPEVMTSVIDASTLSQLDLPTESSRMNAVVDLDVLLEKYLESLFFYFENKNLATEELVTLKIKELTLLLINSQNANPILELLSSLFYREELSLRKIVNANLFEDVSLSEMAAIANMSPSTFKRKFKAEFNTTFSKYVVGKRLQKANKLLHNSNAPVSEIAYDCGFNDPGYFSKLFKKHFDVPPTRYRESIPSKS